MDPIQPVGAMIQPPNPQQGLNAYSSLLGIQQQKQALQIGAAQIPGIQAQSQQQVQTATQRSAMAHYFQTHDMEQHVSEDGTIDLNVLGDPDLRKAAGDSFPQVAQSLMAVKNSQLEAKTRLANLNDTVRSQFDRSVAALREDDDVKQDNQAGRQKVQTAIQQFADSGGPDAQRIAQIYSPMLQHVPQGRLSSSLGHLQMQAQSATEQQGQQNPALGTQFGPNGELIGTGQSRVSGELSAAGPGIGVGLSPAQLAQTITLPNRQVTTLGAFLGMNRRGGGGGGATFPPHVGASSPQDTRVRTALDDAPPANAPGAAQDAYNQSAEAARQQVSSAVGADKDYGLNVNLSNTIRRLSNDTKTGPGSDKWQKALGAIGAPAGLSNVSNFQLLGAYLDRQAATLRAQMGLPTTNEGVQTSQAIQGNTEYQRGAIQDKNDLTQALVEGVHQYRRGLQMATGFSPYPSPVVAQRFTSAWADNFDPNVFKLENAQKRVASGEDRNAVKDILKGLTPQEADSLRQKRKNLQLLAQGQMP